MIVSPQPRQFGLTVPACQPLLHNPYKRSLECSILRVNLPQGIRKTLTTNLAQRNIALGITA